MKLQLKLDGCANSDNKVIMKALTKMELNLQIFEIKIEIYLFNLLNLEL